MRVTLVEDWKQFYKWSEIRLAAAGVALMAAMPEIANNWPQAAPLITQYFPKFGPNWISFTGFVLIILARITEFERHQKDSS